MSLPICCECGGGGSLARDVAVFYMDKEDCSGGPVITQPARTLDQVRGEYQQNFVNTFSIVSLKISFDFHSAGCVAVTGARVWTATTS